MISIYLTNLTHVHQGHYSTDNIPINIGFLAAFLKKHLNSEIEISLFNLPNQLEAELDKHQPDILAASNYAWNFQLSYHYLKHYKALYPEIVTVMGGPNYPGNKTAQKEFLSTYDGIDFYVLKEGEKTLLELVKTLIHNSFEVEACKNTKIIGCQFLKNGSLIDYGQRDRIKDLDEIPSPYLSGLLDEFLDNGFAPMIQTNRGCPFHCAFCYENDPYFSRVNRFSDVRLFEEIDYLNQHVKSKILSIADSNFGILKRDKLITQKIAERREETGWPAWIQDVSTSKENRERVLESIKPLHDTMMLSASLQSMNEETLLLVKRKNFSFEEMKKIMNQAESIGINSLTELIIPLPGETYESHLAALEKIINAGVEFVSVYTSMLLPSTPMQEDNFYDEYKLEKKFRILPRDFGVYQGKKIFEIEQVCVATSTMTLEQYCELRGLFFIIYNFYNLKIFNEIITYLKITNISIFKWLRNIQRVIGDHSGKAGAIYKRFMDDTKSELWDDKDDLTDHYNEDANYKKLESGECGANLIMKYSAIFISELTEFAGIGIDVIKNTEPNIHVDFLNDLLCFSIAKKGDLFDEAKTLVEEEFTHNLYDWIDSKNKTDIDQFRTNTKLVFEVTDEQEKIINEYKKRFGNNEDAQGKIIDKIGISNLYRTVKYQV
jgi:radical SAM superfamily enzyme YgiQ (UPF0313 family)